MKKEYISPEIEIIEFETGDVIVTSTTCDQNQELPDFPAG